VAATCPSCKAPIEIASAKNCTRCGAVLPAEVLQKARATAASRGGIATFVAENWLWIVGPIVLAIVVVFVLVYVFGGDDQPSADIYPVF